MNSFHPDLSKSGRADTRRLFEQTLRQQVALLDAGRARIRIPDTKYLFEKFSGMAYHFKPELFIQTGGETEFFFPDRRFVLLPGEICVMPRGVPHGEVVRSSTGPFENVVVCFYNETVAIHVAREGAPGKPTVDDIHFFKTDLFGDLVEYLNRVAELTRRDETVCGAAIKGLLLAEIALLLSLVVEQDSEVFSESERIFRCQWLIRNNLGDPDLGVAALAKELHCSADRLSKLFSSETGERIVEYITRVRLSNALDAMKNTALSVKEISIACGFNDPNYFARVFRKATGKSPLQFRNEQHQLASMLEKEPKAVYDDHEEHDFGLRPEVMSRAKVKLTK